MVREPAIELINYLKNVDLNMPAYRFIICKLFNLNLILNYLFQFSYVFFKDGTQEGTGKRSTLFHALHYAKRDNWLIIHIPYSEHNIFNLLQKIKYSVIN